MEVALAHLNKVPFSLELMQLDKMLAQYPQIVDLEKKTKVPKAYLAAGVSIFIFGLIFLNIWAPLFTNLIGFLYPAYASFKAIETAGKADDVKWLSYWVIFGLLNVVEFFSEFILYWIPFYFTFKTAFILYLYLPQFNGAQTLYSQFLRPILIKEEKNIDASIAKMKSKAQALVEETLEKKSE